MFQASITSLCRGDLLKMHPRLLRYFWPLDGNLIGLLFGAPRIIAHKACAARDRLVDKLHMELITGYKTGIELDERCG